jgi:hypothetical protein
MKFFLIILFAVSTLRAEEFIVQPKSPVVSKQKLSRSALKENLGNVAKELFAETTALVKRIGAYLQGLTENGQPIVKGQQSITVVVPVVALQTVGKMHEDIAYMQTTCGRLAENLLDDEPQVAKATKISLNTSLQTMRDALAAVKQCQFVTDYQKQEIALRGIVDRMKADPCLRHA